MFIKNVWRRIGEMKLWNKLIISYFIASIIPILLTSVTIYQLSARSVEDASMEFTSMYISQATANMDNFIERHNQSTRSVLLEQEVMKILTAPTSDDMEDLIHDKAAIQGFFSRMTTTYPEIDTVMLVSTVGTIHHYTRAPDIIYPDVLQEQEWYRHALATEKQMFITSAHDRTYYGKDKDGAVFTVGRILWNANGSYAGMILLDMDPNKLLKLRDSFLTIGNRYDIRLVITNEDGGLLYHSDAATGVVPWSTLVGAEYSLNEEIDDTIVLSESSDNGKLKIRAEIPLNTLLASIRSIEHMTLWSIAVSLLFIFLISIFFSYKITNPIINLRRSMKQVELGQYSSLIPVPSAHDEINGLVQSYNKMIIRIKELIEDVYLAGMKRKQAQFLALQSQINPHMLYNTLESIRMKAVVKQQDEIAEMIKILARMFKLSLGRDADRNLIRHEVEYASHYIFLQNIRYDNRFILDVQLSEQVLDTPIVPLIFQPIVENSIKHGFRKYAKGLQIRIEERMVETGEVQIRIIDNGGALTEEKARELDTLLQSTASGDLIPADNEDREGDTGIGLRNIAERLRLQYGDRYQLRIYGEPRGETVVELLIPMQRSGE